MNNNVPHYDTENKYILPLCKRLEIIQFSLSVNAFYMSAVIASSYLFHLGHDEKIQVATIPSWHWRDQGRKKFLENGTSKRGLAITRHIEEKSIRNY